MERGQSDSRLPDEAYSEIIKFFSSFSEVKEFNTLLPLDFKCKLKTIDLKNREYVLLTCGIITMGFKHAGHWVFFNKLKKNELKIHRWDLIFWLEHCKMPCFFVVFDEENGQIYWQSLEDDRDKLAFELEQKSSFLIIRLDKLKKLTAEDVDHEFAQKVLKDCLSRNQFRYSYEKYRKKEPERPPYSRAFNHPRPPASLSPRIEVLAKALNGNGVSSLLYVVDASSGKKIVDYGTSQPQYGGWWRSKTLKSGNYEVYSFISTSNKLFYDKVYVNIESSDLSISLGPSWGHVESNEIAEFNFIGNINQKPKMLTMNYYEEGKRIYVIGNTKPLS
jgi:hypothetical protein